MNDLRFIMKEKVKTMLFMKLARQSKPIELLWLRTGWLEEVLMLSKRPRAFFGYYDIINDPVHVRAHRSYDRL